MQTPLVLLQLRGVEDLDFVEVGGEGGYVAADDVDFLADSADGHVAAGVEGGSVEAVPSSRFQVEAPDAAHVGVIAEGPDGIAGLGEMVGARFDG